MRGNAIQMESAELFAAIVAHSEAAIISAELDGRVLSWNRAAELMFGWTAAEMIGQPLRRIIPADRQDEADRLFAIVKRGDSAPRLETVRVSKDGGIVSVALQVSPMRNELGAVIGVSAITRDITDELQTRSALSDIEARFGLLADNISQLAWIANPKGAIIWFNQRWFEYTGLSPEELQGYGWQAMLHPEHIDRVNQRIARDLASGDDWEDTFPILGKDGQYCWFLSRASPQRDEAGKIINWFGTATDITQQREAERRIELLLMEVNHRSKNLLSVVQAMARRTASSSEDFIPRLERRIAALAANQDVLVQRNWTAVPLGELIAAQLLFLEQAELQTQVIGPEVVIQPATAEALSMTLHELATNAEKYGAYSVPTGLVRISWDISGTSTDAEFVLRWTESGGPKVVQNKEPGFGSRIIRDVPKGRLRGEVETEYAPQGFRFTLRCPAANVLFVPE